MQELNISSEQELEFALFCIDFVAKELQKPTEEVYKKLKSSNLLQDYIIDNYEILHTQGKDYLVEDIIAVMKNKGVV